MKNTALLISLVIFGASSHAQMIDAANIQKHIKLLSSDSLQGRGTGTEGEKKASSYIQGEFKKIGLHPKGDHDQFTQSFSFKSGIHGAGDEGKAVNIVGFLNNQRESTIIIGAHFDHLGNGNQGSSLDANPQGKVHNGADDNASAFIGHFPVSQLHSVN